jgi:hypothetical protein
MKSLLCTILLTSVLAFGQASNFAGTAAAPGPIGSITPSTGAFTTLTESGTNQVRPQPSATGLFANIPGYSETNCGSADLSGSTNCFAVNAIGPVGGIASVNAAWLDVRNGVDDALGITSWGGQINGIGMDVEPNFTNGNGANANGVIIQHYDTAGTYGALTTSLNLVSSALHMGSHIVAQGKSGTFIQRGGTQILESPDGTGRITSTSAPAVTSSAQSGGSIATGHYRFMVSVLNDIGESLPSAASSDLVITAGQYPQASWTGVSGARAYKCFVAFNAGSDPGTTITSYFRQQAQDTVYFRQNLVIGDANGNGTGTFTCSVAVSYTSSTENPLATATDTFYFQRMGNITNNMANPAWDVWHSDLNGNTVGSGTLQLGSATRTTRGQLTLKNINAGQDLTLVGGNGATNPGITVSSGGILIQGCNFTFSSTDCTHTAADTYSSSVTDANAATSGAFKFTSNNTISAGNSLIIWQNGGTTKATLFGNGIFQPLGLQMTNLLISATAPTIGSGFGTSPSIATQNGTASFTINVGTGGSATSGVIGLPAAINGWNCFANDPTTTSTTVFMTKQTASTTTSATIGNFNNAGAAAAWAGSDILSVSCFAR